MRQRQSKLSYFTFYKNKSLRPVFGNPQVREMDRKNTQFEAENLLGSLGDLVGPL